MPERWRDLARLIQEQPGNRPGADKTWVLNAMHQHRMFQHEVRSAQRVAPR